MTPDMWAGLIVCLLILFGIALWGHKEHNAADRLYRLAEIEAARGDAVWARYVYDKCGLPYADMCYRAEARLEDLTRDKNRPRR